MGCIKEDRLSDALDFLRQGERLLVDTMQAVGSHDLLCRLLAVTLNNLACYSKKKACHRSALRYLSQVLAVEKASKRPTTESAATYLNISTVLSELQMPEIALKFAKKALFLFAESLTIEKMNKVGKDEQPQREKESHSLAKSLLTATVNVATICLSMRNYKEAVDVSRRGIDQSVQLLGKGHYLEERLQEIRVKALQKMQAIYLNKRPFDLPPSFSMLEESSELAKPERYHPKSSRFDGYMRPQSAVDWQMIIGQKRTVSLKVDRVKGEVSLNNLIPSSMPTKRVQLASKKKQSISDAALSQTDENPVSKAKESPLNSYKGQFLGNISQGKPYRLRLATSVPKQRRGVQEVEHHKSLDRSTNPKNTQKYRTTMKPPLDTGLSLLQKKKRIRLEKPYDFFQDDIHQANIGKRSNSKGESKLKPLQPIQVEVKKSLIFEASFEDSARENRKSLAPIDEQSNEEMRSKEFAVKDIQLEEYTYHSRLSSNRQSKTNKT